MAEKPGLDAFLRFKELNIKNLLYYQSQLTNLQADLHKMEWDDGEEEWASYADLLMESDSPQSLKVKEIRGVLKEYSMTMFHYYCQYLHLYG